MNSIIFPEFVPTSQKKMVKSKFEFWILVHNNVLNNGPFVPLKLFKHATQCFYSKTKGGVDGAIQQRAILRCSTSHLKWEQKLVSQVFETVAVNSFFP